MERGSRSARIGQQLDRQALNEKTYSEQLRAQEAKPPVASSFEEIMNRVCSCAERVGDTASRLEEIGNRIFGVLPECGSDSEKDKRCPPEGTFEHCMFALDRLDESLSRMERAAGRIERV